MSERSGWNPVLVVDDDDLTRLTLGSVLGDLGLPFIEASSGVEALRVLSRGPVGAILLDHSMPVMTGMELAERVRSMPEHRLVPILFLSAEDSMELRIRAFELGATDFMVKPVAFEEIGARIKAHMGMARRWAETLDALEQRSRTVAAVASLPAAGNTSLRLVCERLSASHGGAAVAVFAGPDLLARAGRPLGDLDTTELAITARSRIGAWTRPLGPPAPPGTWVACAPLYRGPTPAAVLVVEGDPDELLLAAVTDYAAAVSVHLGPASDPATAAEPARPGPAVDEILRRRAFHAVFQPVVDLRSQDTVGYEALTRLDDGTPVLDFLDEAEAAALRPQCELAFLEKALTAGAPGWSGWLSVNISPSVLVAHAPQVAELVKATDATIVVELTEHERIDDYAAVQEAVAALGPRVKLSVDDMGAGYASMRHVVDLHPQFLKLDRCWVSGIDADLTRQGLVRSIVAFCEQTGTSLIAEGIERAEEKRMLETLGVRYGQGYLLGRPAVPEECSIPLQ